MSLRDLPEELHLVMMKRLNLEDLFRLYLAYSEFNQFFYLGSLERTMGNITLNTLCQLHAQCEREDQRTQCFHQRVFDKLIISSFNEIVHLYLNPENADFFSNNKVIESLGGEILLVNEPDMDYTSEFWTCCRELLETIQGEILLVLVHVDPNQLWYSDEESNFRSRVEYLIVIADGRRYETSKKFGKRKFSYALSVYDGNYDHALGVAALSSWENITSKVMSSKVMESPSVERYRRNLDHLISKLHANGESTILRCRICRHSTYMNVFKKVVLLRKVVYEDHLCVNCQF